MGNQISLCVGSSSQNEPSRPVIQNQDGGRRNDTGGSLLDKRPSNDSDIAVSDIDDKANKLLKREFKEKWEEKTYEAIRLDGNLYGFTSQYLWLSANVKEFSSSAETSTLVEFAKLDLEKGTTIAELVFSCCQFFPKKEAIDSLIELGKHNENEKKVIESVFEFQNQSGFNCLISIFDMAVHNRIANNNEFPSGLMLGDIEESCLHMIELAKSSDLDLEKVLNHPTKNGQTLFFLASINSELITRRLLLEPVRANSITDKFITPYFRVRFEVCFLKIISPLVRQCETSYDQQRGQSICSRL